MGYRPSIHKQLLSLPTVVGSFLFTAAGLDLSGGWLAMAFIPMLVFSAIPFQYTYTALFPVEPIRVAEVAVMRTAALFILQIAFWVAIFVLASNLRARHGT